MNGPVTNFEIHIAALDKIFSDVSDRASVREAMSLARDFFSAHGFSPADVRDVSTEYIDRLRAAANPNGAMGG